MAFGPLSRAIAPFDEVRAIARGIERIEDH
jgi:hypothetical protein